MEDVEVSKINKVAGYRVMLGLTQEEMGKILGMSKQQYNAKENRKTRFNDDEKKHIKEIIIRFIPDITIDDIFF